jgi:hypothetical protein
MIEVFCSRGAVQTPCKSGSGKLQAPMKLVIDPDRMTGNREVIGSSVGLVTTNALLVRESGTRSRFSPRNGGRVPWRKADVNAPRRQSSNYPI